MITLQKHFSDSSQELLQKEIPAVKIITDVISNRELVERIFQKHGCAAEHNYYCYLYNIEPGEKPYIAVFEDDMAVVAKKETDNNIRLFTEILAPHEMKPSILKKFLDHVYSSDNPSKVWVEVNPRTRRSVLRHLKDCGYKCNKINYTLIWPIFEMDKWDGDSMSGSSWKDIRYYWNKFFREHDVRFVTAREIEKEELKKLVYEWRDSRTTGDRAYVESYINAIENNFEGYDIHRIMLVDGKVGAITAGFKSRDGYYYSSIGLYSKSIDRSNEIANMDDLLHLKKSGFKVVDFGGVEKSSLDFKKKFRPTGFYKTHVFSIVRN